MLLSLGWQFDVRPEQLHGRQPVDENAKNPSSQSEQTIPPTPGCGTLKKLLISNYINFQDSLSI